MQVAAQHTLKEGADDVTAGFYHMYLRECKIAGAFDGAKIAIREGKLEDFRPNVDDLKQLHLEMIKELKAGGNEMGASEKPIYANRIKDVIDELHPIMKKLKEDINKSDNEGPIKKGMMECLDSLETEIRSESMHATMDMSRKEP